MRRRDVLKLALGLSAVLPAAGRAIQPVRTTFTSDGNNIRTDIYSLDTSPSDAAPVVLLHGPSGPQSRNAPYRRVATRLAQKGYRVWLPHYLDATGGSAADPVDHYRFWVRAVQDAIAAASAAGPAPPQKICLVGYSLGASVALAIACVAPTLGGVVACSGSCRTSTSCS